MKQNKRVLKLVQLAMLVALIFVLQYVGTIISKPFAAIGIELSFVLIPIVVGAFALGYIEGAILGLVFGVMTVGLTVTAPGSMTYVLFDTSPWLYSLTAVIKAVMAGLGSGLIYKGLGKLFKGRLEYLRVTLASASAPIINTGIFLLGMVLFFSDTIAEKWSGGENVFLFLTALIGVNFVVELAINIVLSPAILRIIQVVGSKSKKPN